MPLDSLFRQEAIEHRSAREPIDRVALVTVPYDWVVLIVLAALCFISVLWAVFVKIELSLPVDVIVIKPTDDRVVVASLDAHVRDVLVEEDTRVEEGDALVRIVVPDLHRRLSEAEERERIIEEEIDTTDTYDSDLNRLLIESRLETATWIKAIKNDEVILSPYSGEVIGVEVSNGQVVTAGQEVIHVRVGESADTFAITFVPQNIVRRVLNDSDVKLRCPDPQGVVTLSARVISDLPQNTIESNFAIDAGFDPDHQQISLLLSNSATVEHGAQCEGYISLNPQTPLQMLLGGT